ncbi:MAG: GTP-binding protein [Candidatus Tectomicrobia bacterium]|nr:GTP-binding protein [Candidatus Tectomicrobia bacterium]
MPKPITLITGALGAGKTTTILGLLARHPEFATAVLVNEFGQIGIDAATLKGGGRQLGELLVREVPGGCVCCVAAAELARGLATLLADPTLDRILVEPTGLAKTSQLVDLLRRRPFDTLADLQPIITLVDAGRFARSSWQAVPYFHDQVEAAEVLVVNHCDAVDEATTRRCLEIARALYPPKWRVIATSFGRLPDEGFAAEPTAERRWGGRLSAAQMEAGDAPSAHAGESPASPSRTAAPHPPQHGAVLHDHEAFTSASWLWPPTARFSAARLDLLFARWGADRGSRRRIERAKGVFATEQGWLLMELAGGRPHQRPTHHRRDSRCTIILAGQGEVARREALEERLGTEISSCLVTDQTG